MTNSSWICSTAEATPLTMVATLTAQHETCRKRHYPKPVPPMTKRPPVQFPITAQDP